MERRFKTFTSMLLDPLAKNGGFHYDDGGEIHFLPYRDFAASLQDVSIKPGASIGIFCDGTLDCLRKIFAYVEAKKQVVLLDPLTDIEILKKQIHATHVDVLEGPAPLVKSLEGELEPASVKGNGILFFTSGTTSSSKAVELSEEKLCSSAYNGSALLPLETEDILLSLLPWNHVYGFVCCLLWPLYCGASIALGRGRRHFYDDPYYFRPTAMCLVSQMAGFLLMRDLYNPECRLILIGAGDCPDSIMEGIQNKGIRLSFGYGLTETSSGVALSLGDDPRKMTICPEAKIIIAEDGEILIKAPRVMMKGYYEDKAHTDEVLIDGTLHTGDLGRIDKKGQLSIIGRKKEILLLNDGTKVFLPEFEAELKTLFQTNELAVLQDEINLLVLVFSEIPPDYEKKIESFNARHPYGERIRRVIALHEELPKTATGKIKRYAIPLDNKKGE